MHKDDDTTKEEEEEDFDPNPIKTDDEDDILKEPDEPGITDWEEER